MGLRCVENGMPLFRFPCFHGGISVVRTCYCQRWRNSAKHARASAILWRARIRTTLRRPAGRPGGLPANQPVSQSVSQSACLSVCRPTDRYGTIKQAGFAKRKYKQGSSDEQSDRHEPDSILCRLDYAPAGVRYSIRRGNLCSASFCCCRRFSSFPSSSIRDRRTSPHSDD